MLVLLHKLKLQHRLRGVCWWLVTDCRPKKPRNNPEEQRPRLHRGALYFANFVIIYALENCLLIKSEHEIRALCIITLYPGHSAVILEGSGEKKKF